ncbi:putative RNA binding protein [Blattamonas nauphoetae]|uniref:RNA binding protein n=1 Tax=Blattamonas nauphoetae TaxID=2049346 RepID=A0ABQ9Y1S4_9EUKA|nr:putative RNA binding protein [Blattamonas nauphoetae]
MTQELNKQEPTKSRKSPKKPCFKVFVGNLPFNITKEDIETHFKPCGTITSVRILTKKDGTPRGCCFIEFADSKSEIKAIHMHHSLLKDRSINVEKTAGGGGNSIVRKRKIAKQRLESALIRRETERKKASKAAPPSEKTSKD